MKKGYALTLLAVVLMTAGLRADVAISIRYYREVGASHYHLYLYTDDGKVIRQLTAPEDAQDTLPMFSNDGKEIVFTRETKGKKQVMAIDADGQHLRTVEKAPANYPATDLEEIAYQQEGGGDNDKLWTARGDDYFIKTPDGKQEIILKSGDNFKRKDPTFEGICFSALEVRDLESGAETHVATGGDAPDNYCDFALCKQSPFLLQGSMRVLFYWQWQGSTDGSRFGVVDLRQKKAQFLSKNPDVAIGHGTREGFFCICDELYQPLGKTGHTVNCMYLDWWNAGLERTRFANAISLFGGASVRVKDQPQLDIPPGDHE